MRGSQGPISAQLPYTLVEVELVMRGSQGPISVQLPYTLVQWWSW